ncbi:MAG: ABC transporter substrate-binding protein [Burkholderiales bacterium]|nr:ABC transporter substrate-binding protein [Burkholderiales bacterium]
MIGYLLVTPVVDPPSGERQAFLDGLRAFGRVPGRNVEIVYASAEGHPEFVDDVARDLVMRKPDVIVASGAIAVLAARRATAEIPVVIMAVGDPVGIGAVQSLSRPERNVTGVSFLSSDLAGKRVQLMADLLPALRRVAVMWDPRNANAQSEVNATFAAIARLGIAEARFPIGAESGVAGVLERIGAQRPDALYVAFEGGTVMEYRTAIAEFGLRQRLPVVSGWSQLTEAGGLLSYAPDLPAMFRRSAYYVHRILEGTAPRDLPVEQASTVEMVINLRTAKALGVAVPQSLLLRADRIIQ